MTNPVNARTDPETGLRFYEWNGVLYPSVTTLRRLVGMPFRLHNWSLSQVINRAIEEHKVVDAMLTRPVRKRERVRDKNVAKEVGTYLRLAATEQRDLAGDRGTAIHDAIRAGAPLASITDPEVRQYVAQYLDFLERTKAQVVWQEKQIWNLTLGYAGSADAMLYLPESEYFPVAHLALVDYKSSGGVYLDHAVQIMAYAMGEFVGEGNVIDTEATAQLIAAERMGLLHLAPESWEYVDVRPTNQLFAGFAGQLAFARFLNDHQNSIEPLVAHRVTGGTTLIGAPSTVTVIKGGRP